MNLCERRLISSIHYLFSHDEWLTNFFFHHKELKLRIGIDELLEEAMCLSDGTFVLIQAAIDLWNGEGGLKLTSVLNTLDDENVIAFVRGLLHYRGIDFNEILQGDGVC